MPIGRPLSFDPEQALVAATACFWKRGYESCSLHDLLTATRLSKSSLYQQFGSKSGLFDRCLAHYTDEMAALLEQLLAHAPSGEAFIQMMLTQVIAEKQPAKGCLIFNTASEFGQRDPAVAQRVHHGLLAFRSVFLSALQKDHDAGLIAVDADLEALADYLIAAIGGLRAMVKSGAEPASLKSTVAIILRSLA